MEIGQRHSLAGCIVLAGLIVLAESTTTGGQVVGAEESVASSPSASKSIVQTIDALVPKLMVELHVPGVSIAAIEDRRMVWHRAYGVRRAGSPEKIDRETIFEACSMTKPTFAYLTLKLAEQGKLELDKPLVEYLDKPYLPDEPRYKSITARMVLSHTTGFPNWRKGGWQKGGPLPILFEPGSKFGYSGEGFLYLQRVVEHITGMPAERYIKQNLFEPLGMRLSSYIWEDRYKELAAAGHDGKGKVKKNRSLFRRANAGYSLYCTPCEYACFLVEIMKEDRSAEHSINSRSIEAMLTRTTIAPNRKPIDRGGKPGSGPVYWGLGWPINTTNSGDRIYHGGSNGTGFRCYCEFDRRRGTGIVVMTNAVGGVELWRKLIATVGNL
jgi:CubicO group peptidase (beta-lactamase class C family)